ncbi:MAG: hypothetical protein HY654_09765, partial [Acidobacteria bacterium]|nr:hypothetical protein [Acidobacteriota bacterium]
LTLVARHTPEHDVLARMVKKLTRARRSLGDRAPLPGALTEEAVARSLLDDGGRTEAERPAAPLPYRVVDLSHAATVEQARLIQLRRLASNRGHGTQTKLKLGPTKKLGPTSLLIIRPPRRRHRPEVRTSLFIFRTQLRDGTGSIVDDLLLPIVTPGVLPRLENCPDSEVRRVVAAISSRLTPRMDHLVGDAIRQRIRDVGVVHRHVLRVRVQSEDRIAAVLAEARNAAAGRRGQGSLFYRTAGEISADQVSDRLVVAARRQDLRRARLSAAGALAADSPELIAVLPL